MTLTDPEGHLSLWNPVLREQIKATKLSQSISDVARILGLKLMDSEGRGEQTAAENFAFDGEVALRGRRSAVALGRWDVTIN